jgi:hypothetical protein
LAITIPGVAGDFAINERHALFGETRHLSLLCCNKVRAEFGHHLAFAGALQQTVRSGHHFVDCAAFGQTGEHDDRFSCDRWKSKRDVLLGKL